MGIPKPVTLDFLSYVHHWNLKIRGDVPLDDCPYIIGIRGRLHLFDLSYLSRVFVDLE